MKKIIAILLTLALIMPCMTAFAASTATSVYNESKSNAVDQYFTTSGTIENGGNGFVTLLVTTDGSISVDNIMYIDQTVADENGNFSFTDYIPKINVPAGEKYIVKVGATSLPAAISGGYLELPEPTGYAVSGTVSFQGTTLPVLNLKKSGSVVATVTVASDGTFSMTNIPDGEYYMIVTKNAHLPAVATVTVNGGNVTIANTIKLLAGDLVPTETEREIGINDLSMVIGIYGAKIGSDAYKAECDINDDGEVGIAELSAIIGNYGAKADALSNE